MARWDDVGRGAPPAPAGAVHAALGTLRLQAFTGVLWVSADGSVRAEGVSTFTPRLWDARHNSAVRAVAALTLGAGQRARVDLVGGWPVRQGAEWATLDSAPYSSVE